MGAVDYCQAMDRTLPSERLEDLQPQALPVAVIDLPVLAIYHRAIPAASARAQHVDYAADDPLIIDTARSAPSSRHQKLDTRPLRLAQPIGRRPPTMLLKLCCLTSIEAAILIARSQLSRVRAHQGPARAQHKADLGVPNASDEAVLARVDDITAILFASSVREWRADDQRW